MAIHGALLASALPGSPVSGRECAWMGHTPSANDTDLLVLECLKADTQKLLDAHEIRGTVQARVKSAASLLAKMRRKGLEANQVFDRLALRVIVEDASTAYKVRDLLERRHRVIEGRRKDYIANPKPNGYQSLHSSVQTLLGPVAEFQVRTHQMHFEAEHGDAAHWRYKLRATSGRASFASASGSDGTVAARRGDAWTGALLGALRAGAGHPRQVEPVQRVEDRRARFSVAS